MFGKIFTLLAFAAVTASAATADFCFGWNVQNCQSVTKPTIPLLNVGPVNVNCDNCYFETSGKLALDLDPFKIGIEDMVISLIGEVDAEAVGTWSFEKQESPVVASVTILREPIPVTLDIPVVVDVRGSFNGDARGKIGIKAIGNIGSWESIHRDGRWEHVLPHPTWNISHTMTFSAGITGGVDILVNPQVNIHAGDIFKGSLSIEQNAAADLQLSTETREKAEGGDLECTVCTFLVGQVEQMVLSNKTVAEIESTLSELCDHLTGSWQSTCQTIIESDIPLIIGYLEDKLSPSVICEKIGLCASSVDVAADGQCSLCSFLVGEVETLLTNGVVEEKIETVLDDMCTHLSGSMSSMCVNFVHNYLPTVIQLLVEKFPASEICSKIGMCPATLLSHVYRIRILDQASRSPALCTTFTEEFKIDWEGELKIDLIHVDKTFDVSLMDWKRVVPYGPGCAAN